MAVVVLVVVVVVVDGTGFDSGNVDIVFPAVL